MNKNINNKSIVLSFDLDFTLIDNSKGIIESFNHALKKHDLPPVESSKVVKMIGTPLDIMFSEVSKLNPTSLSAAFREYYGSKGIYKAFLYPGVREKLEHLKQYFILGVVTSKKQEMAIKLLKFLGICEYFNHIIGETSNIKSKDSPYLKELLFKKYPHHAFVVIGDHLSDRMLAKSLNCPFIGVLTGTHAAEQLKQGTNLKVLILNDVIEISEERILSLF